MMPVNPITGGDDVTPILIAAMEQLGVAHQTELGCAALNSGKILVRASSSSIDGSETAIFFDTYVARHDNQARTHVPSTLVADNDSGSDPLLVACLEWVQCCLDPVRRSIDREAEVDTYFNLYVDTDRQQLFDVFSGDYLIHGENSEQWSKRFVHSFIDWVIANGSFQFPARRFNLLRLGMETSDGETSTGLCQLNGAPWPEGNSALSKLDWPGLGAQRLLSYVVLRRLPQGPK